MAIFKNLFAGNRGSSIRTTTRHSMASRAGRQPAFEHLELRQLLAVIEYPLVNAGFESPDLDINNSWHPAVEGWTTTGSPGTTYEVPWAEPSPAPEGDQYVFGDSSNWSLRQTGPTIETNTRYIFSVELFPLTTGSTLATVLLRDANTLTTLAGAANAPSGIPQIQQVELPEGEWTKVTIGFSSSGFAAPSIGNPLEIRINGTRLAIDNASLKIDDSVHDFYVSSSTGSDSNDGFSDTSAFQDFASLAPYLPLLPGERILLKAGDTFTEELNIRGKGTAQAHVALSSYGEGPNPVIRRQDLANDVGVIWNNASYTDISNIDVEHAKLGIYLRYESTDFGSRDVTITDSNFRDLTDPTLEPSNHNFEFAWSDAIWVGGQAWGDAEFTTRLENLTIRNVTSENAAHLFGTGWYFPAPYKSRLKNLVIEDSVAINNLAGAFQLFGVDGGHIKRVHSLGGGGQDTWSGTTLGFIQDSQNFLIEDNEFSYIDRAQAADGSGMDFEGNTNNITFRNNVIHNNAGAALLILSTGGPNTNLVIEDNTFYNNARDPWNDEINSEIQGGGSGHTGIIRNNGIYRGDSSINFFSPSADWSGFTRTGNRELNYDDVRLRPTRWEFDTDGDFEGWGGFNHWQNPQVAGGMLTGESSDVDPYVYSAPTWVNSNESTYAWIRMSQTAGSVAQVFYTTETDPVWEPTKSVFFDVVADGNMRDYFVDLSSSPDTTGVITQIRLDPTIVASSEMAIDFVRLTNSDDPNQIPPSSQLPPPLEMTFTSIAAEDGYVIESAQNSGVGGTVNNSSWTFRFGDSSSNQAYRPILSFDTSSLPDNASIVEATLGITRVGNPTGNIPIGVATSQYGDILVDLATPAFGSNTLTAEDWQSDATKLGVSKFAWPAYLSGMEIYSRLENPDNDLVNVSGKTQYRIRYQNDDDNDGVADYMQFATSNHFNSAYHPTLVVKYYINDNPSADFDDDGDTDGTDFLILQRNYGTLGTARKSDGDANVDTDVDGDDLSIWTTQYGASAPLAISSLSNETTVPSEASARTLPVSFDNKLMASSVRLSRLGFNEVTIRALDDFHDEVKVNESSQQPSAMARNYYSQNSRNNNFDRSSIETTKSRADERIEVLDFAYADWQVPEWHTPATARV